MIHTVKLQNLPFKGDHDFSEYNSRTIKENFDRKSKWNKTLVEPLLFKYNYEEYENQTTLGDNFLGTFLHAYNVHGDVMISPDDI